MKYFALPKLDKKRLVATNVIKHENKTLTVEELKQQAKSLKQEKTNFVNLKHCENFSQKRLETSLEKFYDLYKREEWEDRHFSVAQRFFDNPKYIKVYPYDAIEMEYSYLDDVLQQSGYSKVFYYTIAPKTFDEKQKISLKEFSKLSRKNKVLVVGLAHEYCKDEVKMSQYELEHAFDDKPEIFNLYTSDLYWQTLKENVAERYELDKEEYLSEYNKAREVLMKQAIACFENLKEKREKTNDASLDDSINYCETFEKKL